MNPAAKLDTEARVAQMKVQARQFAATMALELMKVPNYSMVTYKNDPNVPGSDSVPEMVGGKVDHVTLLAMAGDIEAYILGNLEQEAKDAIEAASKSFNAPKIVRP